MRTPTLFVYGTNDPVANVEIGERVVAALPQAHLDLVHGAGHLPWLDDPAGVGERIRRFLVHQ